jgi:hypothetical protein
MGMIRFASSLGSITVLPYKEVQIATQHSQKRLALTIDPAFLYFSCHGIRGDYPPNQNGDFFAWKQLTARHVSGRYVWETWQDRDVLENHNPKHIRGFVPDTFPIAEVLSIDMLNAIDKKKFPKLAKDIETGVVTDTSMGLSCDRGICSVCGNIATDEREWCQHMKYEKGKRINGELVYEINEGLEGLENSIITSGRGAEPISKIREVLARKTNLSSKEIDKLILAKFAEFSRDVIGASEDEVLTYLLDRLGLKLK